MESHAIMRNRFAVPLVLFASFALMFAANVSAQTNSAPTNSNRADWMREARFGVMMHFLHDWIMQDQPDAMTPENWNQLIDGFDVETLAQQLESVGAKYFLISIGQNSGYYLAPNATYDRLAGIKPSRLSRRDLISDLSAALAKRKIRLMVYLPSGGPAGDEAAKAALKWQNGPYRNAEFQRSWEA